MRIFLIFSFLSVFWACASLPAAAQAVSAGAPSAAAGGGSGSAATAAATVATKPPERIIRPMIAVDTTTLHAEGMRIRLWGIKAAQTAETPLDLKALDLMDKLIGSEQVNCRVMTGAVPDLSARCTVQTGQDLALELLSNGYAVVDRRQTYNTVFASAYAGAQENARLQSRGVWRVLSAAQKDSGVPKWLQPHMDFLVPMMLLVGPLMGLGLVAVVMWFWLRRMQQFQQLEAEHARTREGAVEKRERLVLASTLEGELAENRNRIEAFLVIYGDMLKSLKDKNEQPKYQQVGDIVQKHPGYSKVVFDANVNKLSLLDIKLAGKLSKLYAAMPKEQEYITLDPDVTLDTAIRLVEKVMKDAENVLPVLNTVLEELQAFTAQRA